MLFALPNGNDEQVIWPPKMLLSAEFIPAFEGMPRDEDTEMMTCNIIQNCVSCLIPTRDHEVTNVESVNRPKQAWSERHKN